MITGIAAVYYDGTPETEFRVGERYAERIIRGAFDDVLASGDDVVALFNHDTNQILGRRSAGSLVLTDTEVGLRYEVPRPSEPSQVYLDVERWQQRGEVSGSSFGFITLDERYVRDGSRVVREILKVELLDVGPVTFPAYGATEKVGKRSVRYVCNGKCCDIPKEFAKRSLDAANKVLMREAMVKARLLDLGIL